MLTSVKYRDILTPSARVRVGEVGQGRTVVLLHDLFGSHEDFAPIVERLANKLHLVLLDLPGFGDSEKPRKYTYGYEGFAESVLDALAGLSLSRVSLLAHGFGGGVALTLASRHPNMVDRLALVDPAVYDFSPPWMLRAALAPGLGRLLVKQLAGARTFGRFMPSSPSRDFSRIRAEYERFNSPDGREAALLALTACSDLRPVRAVVPRIAAPTLVLWGDSDPVFAPHQGRRLARELPQGKLVVLGAGHWPHQELPDAFAAHLLDFVDPRVPEPSHKSTAKPRAKRRPED